MVAVKKWNLDRKMNAAELLLAMYKNPDHTFQDRDKAGTEKLLAEKLADTIASQISGLKGMADEEFEHQLRTAMTHILENVTSDYIEHVMTHKDEDRGLRCALVVIGALECADWSDWSDYLNKAPTNLDGIAYCALRYFIYEHKDEIYERINNKRR